jgi:hypothetical protein
MASYDIFHLCAFIKNNPEYIIYENFNNYIDQDENLRKLSDEDKHILYELVIGDRNGLDSSYKLHGFIVSVFYNDIEKYNKCIKLIYNILKYDINKSNPLTCVIILTDVLASNHFILDAEKYIKILLDYGADPNVVDNNGYSAYDHAKIVDNKHNLNLHKYIEDYLIPDTKYPGYD